MMLGVLDALQMWQCKTQPYTPHARPNLILPLYSPILS